MSFNVTADEIVMVDVAELSEEDQASFANLLIDLMIDPWVDSRPYEEDHLDDPMRLKPFGQPSCPLALYWIDVERRLVTVLDLV